MPLPLVDASIPSRVLPAAPALREGLAVEHAANQTAMRDQKTGLPNRALFDDRRSQAVAGAERHGRRLAVMFLDLDRVNPVNDAPGHAAGDAVLTVVAERLLRHAREEDSICRNGGDEFLVLLINPADRDAVANIASLVREAIALPIGLGRLEFKVAPRIGIALYPEHGQGGQALISHADAAMGRSRRLGSPFEFFDPLADADADAPGALG